MGEVTDEVWDEVMLVNVKSVHLCAQALGEAMLDRGTGRIIVLAHAVGIAGVPDVTVYSASKAPVIQYVKSLGQEWARTGVTVNAIAPGWFDGSWPDQHVEVDTLPRFNPTRRLGRPEELGPLAVYLASDEARNVTASIAVIDGGQICHA